MTTHEAKALLSGFTTKAGQAQRWLDLGCGTGTFTRALAEYLPAGSEVIGIDQTPQDLPPPNSNDVQISFLQADMQDVAALPQKVDGILMANALHYIAEPAAFIEKLKELMRSDPQFLIVEYDTERANPWVPYPLSLERLSEVFPETQTQIQLLGRRKSIYKAGGMYAAWVRVS